MALSVAGAASSRRLSPPNVAPRPASDRARPGWNCAGATDWEYPEYGDGFVKERPGLVQIVQRGKLAAERGKGIPEVGGNRSDAVAASLNVS
jgi:hypothetical protein